MQEPRLTSSPPPTADCVVVGGGVLGAATAFHLARAGLRVVVLEQRPRLATLTTAASAGGFRAQFEDPAQLQLVRASIDVFESFAEHTGLADWDIGLHLQGYLWVTTRPDGGERYLRIVEAQRRAGLDDVEILSGDEARDRFPFLAGTVTSARFRARDGWLDPKRLALGFATASQAAFSVSTELLSIEVEAGRVRGVKTSAGDVACPAVVVAAGPFSGRIAALAGVTLPLSLKLRHKLAFPVLADTPPAAPMTIDEDTGAHFRPEGAGALVLCPEDDAPSGGPVQGPPIDQDFAFRLLDPESPRSVARVAPFWRDVWRRGTDAFFLASGQYSLTPDRRPLLGPTAIGGLFLNAGHSGHGIMASAEAGRRVAAAALGRFPAADDPFRPDRPQVEVGPARDARQAGRL